MAEKDETIQVLNAIIENKNSEVAGLEEDMNQIKIRLDLAQ